MCGVSIACGGGAGCFVKRARCSIVDSPSARRLSEQEMLESVFFWVASTETKLVEEQLVFDAQAAQGPVAPSADFRRNDPCCS